MGGRERNGESIFILSSTIPTREQPKPRLVAPANVHWLPKLSAADRDTQEPDLCHATSTPPEDSAAAHREGVVSGRLIDR